MQWHIYTDILCCIAYAFFFPSKFLLYTEINVSSGFRLTLKLFNLQLSF